MRIMARGAFAGLISTAALASVAAAQPAPTASDAPPQPHTPAPGPTATPAPAPPAAPPVAAPQPPPDPNAWQGAAPVPQSAPAAYPGYSGYAPYGTEASTTPQAQNKKKEPKRGDFDAGGQARFPSGPDEAGAYDSFNWVAVDLKGRYFLLDSVTVNASAPLAVKKPDALMDGTDPRMLGGMSVTLEAITPQLPSMPFVPKTKGTKVGLSVTGSYMREGAMLLSPRDFPLFTGDMQPGVSGGLISIVKLSTLVDFSFIPTFVFQSGTTENLTALQVPLALSLDIGLVKLSADLGIYTGDDISLRPSRGGRIATGAALDVKLGRIIAHAGAGFASLLVDDMGMYPSIGESMYVDLNVKFAK